jgi:hypothetical protein
MSKPSLPKGATAQELTEYRKNRMIYANFLIQQQNQTAGYSAYINLETNTVAPGSIMPQLLSGAIYTTAAERDQILLTNAQNLPSFPPSPPTILSFTQANESVVLVFSEGNNGGSYIFDYEYSLNNGLSFTSAGTVSSPLIINGLTNGQTYSISIRAVNKNGPGPVSNTITATPDDTLVSFTTVQTTTWVAPANIYTVEYLVVAGGGGSGGGYDTGGGAGGGGGMVLSGRLTVIPGTTYTVVVGDGGTAGISNRTALPEIPGGAGENSVFASIIALGGGGGWPSRQPAGAVNGNGGAAAINPGTASQGGNGGGSNGGGGGGGGSSGAGTNRSGSTAGSGGAGTASSLSGSSIVYGAGANGANGSTNTVAVAGTTNTGNGARAGGASSGSDEDGAKGGSGIVILKY